VSRRLFGDNLAPSFTPSLSASRKGAFEMPLAIRSLSVFACFKTLVALTFLTAVVNRFGTAVLYGADKPNIIFILADDYGIGGVSCYGADKYKTPQLDALADRGLRFEYCFAAPLCGPSRSLFMTGRYGFRTGALHNNSAGKVHPDKEVSIARVLQQAGYKTAVVGKWRQLSHFRSKEDARKWGFDEFLIWGIPIDGTKNDERYWTPNYNLNGKPLTNVEGEYGPDLLHEYVADFISRHRDQPFFVYYPTPLIHGPIVRTPDSPVTGADHFSENIAYLDKLVGKLAMELDRQKLREKTLIVFTGDNGCTERASGQPRSAGSIRGRAVEGDKGTLLEGGSRVPLIVSWPGTVPAGRVLNDLISFSDFFPTFAELAGATVPANVTIDGRSFAAQLRGQAGRPREEVYVELDDQHYVRDDRWKLDNNGNLFDMREAPFQQISVPTDAADPAAQAARKKLQAALEKLHPSAKKPARLGK
jgi:arylsulfatase A